MMKRNIFLLVSALAFAAIRASADQTNTTTNVPAWLSRPLSMADALDLGLQQNGQIQRGRSDLEAQYGVVVQTRAIALPTARVNGNYIYTEAVDPFPGNLFPVQNQSWNANVQILQSIYQGGQIRSALRSAELTKDQALLNYQSVIADALLLVRIAYYDVLSAAEQIVVEEASVKLLTQELDDQNRRYQAGTVPRFNVLRAEVELANERPKLIRARNDFRVSKNNLVTLLGYHVPPEISEDVPVQLTDKLDAQPYQIELPMAIARALTDRPELAAARKEEMLRKEGVISAKGGYKPTVQVLAGYGGHNTAFNNNLSHAVEGVTTGAQLSWTIFDGLLTQGRIDTAKADYEGAKIDVDNQTRRIELEVRTQYSQFIEAREVLESQKKVQEQAEEALRLASARSEAGTGTQLDVLSAQTSLTEARSTQVQALHDYDVARVRLERAIGLNIMTTNSMPAEVK